MLKSLQWQYLRIRVSYRSGKTSPEPSQRGALSIFERGLPVRGPQDPQTLLLLEEYRAIFGIREGFRLLGRSSYWAPERLWLQPLTTDVGWDLTFQGWVVSNLKRGSSALTTDLGASLKFRQRLLYYNAMIETESSDPVRFQPLLEVPPQNQG